MSWKCSVASMKLTSGNRCFLLVKSVVILGAEFRSLRSRGHLSCAYLGQCSRKCSTVALGWPHTGHLGLSTNLNLKRYWLSGTCPTLSWNRRLAASRDISLLPINFIYFCEAGVSVSRYQARRYLGEVDHIAAHFFLSKSYCA